MAPNSDLSGDTQKNTSPMFWTVCRAVPCRAVLRESAYPGQIVYMKARRTSAPLQHVRVNSQHS
ncbi:hypothetical protein E3U43_003828 [Larimichthys crocea]|uniref:Uncharacterized protein n=1 Tax=Larimichthys crocea TaxID=215358 RepID=A0ACD3RIS4_LARCR|nr:hypothetical protein E3U43_003828 [Larimichthys crocea]